MTGSSDPSAASTLTEPTPADSPEVLQRRTLATLLDHPRYEVLPLAGTAEEVAAHVPTTLPVTVTASPRRGMEPTLALTEKLARGGYSAVPHLAARLLYDEQHLAEVLARLDEAGVRDVFVVAGDGDPSAGDFSNSLQLLAAIKRIQRLGPARGLPAMGISGYPEGHPLVPAEELDRALLAKQSLSSYVVTQMCFDPGAVLGWMGHARELGVRLPVHVGIAGAVDRLKLLRISARIGVGGSIRFLRKHQGGSVLLRSGGYRPDALLAELSSAAGDGALAGLHVYTLGDVATTERWRRELLDQLNEEDGHG